MANIDRKKGFKPQNIGTARTKRDLMATGETTQPGDVLYRNSDGLLTATASTNKIAGIQASFIKDSTDGTNNATSLAGDFVSIWDDPDEIFVGQISTYAQTDPYTTRVSAGCFDVAGSAGAQYINAAASTLDTFKVLGLDYEENGVRSAVGANAKVECTINPGKHERTALT